VDRVRPAWWRLPGAVRIEPSSSAGGSVALEVDDLDALCTRLKAEGVRFKAENIASPVCRMAVILDSEGNSIVLHQLNRADAG
jgi:predicted enzyme related to lactoylglutathione lyase